MKVLLDTHVVLWWFGDRSRLAPDIRRVLEDRTTHKLHMSAISLWEIATLHELGRIELDRPLFEWLEESVAALGLRVETITPAVAAAVAALPSSFHRDPADRIIVATAKVSGFPVATQDRRIRESRLVSMVS